MGYMKHDAIIVTTSDCRPGGLPDIEAFRASLPEEFRRLVIGPIPSAINDYVSYAFLPDGSKDGWPTSDEGDAHREAFAALFSHVHGDGSTHDDAIAVTYGGEHRYEHAPQAVYTHGFSGKGADRG